MGRRRYLSVVALVAALLAAASLYAREWNSLARDKIHDPKGPGITELQEPREALSVLPPDEAGNQVLWVQSLEEGYVNPRTNVFPETSVNVLDLDVILKDTSQMYYVRFPHKPHTEWLDCRQCHEELFQSKAGATKINMLMILMGQKCGLCHGAVAFPLTECARCHSVPWDDMPVGAGKR
jgi:c(7)-type cytochrome triheme protein